MLERDYVMRKIMQIGAAIRRSLLNEDKTSDPLDSAYLLESAVGQATNLDGEVLLSLAPNSIAQVMGVSGVDERVAEYIARSLMLAADFLMQAGQSERADLRRAQAHAVADAYKIELPATLQDFCAVMDKEWEALCEAYPDYIDPDNPQVASQG